MLSPLDPDTPSSPEGETEDDVLSPLDPDAERPLCVMEGSDNPTKMLTIEAFRSGVDKLSLDIEPNEDGSLPPIAMSAALDGDGVVLTVDGEPVANVKGVETLSASDILLLPTAASGSA